MQSRQMVVLHVAHQSFSGSSGCLVHMLTKPLVTGTAGGQAGPPANMAAPAPAPPRSAAAPMRKAARRKAAQKAALQQRLRTLSQEINECKNRLAKKKRKGKGQ